MGKKGGGASQAKGAGEPAAPKAESKAAAPKPKAEPKADPAPKAVAKSEPAPPPAKAKAEGAPKAKPEAKSKDGGAAKSKGGAAPKEGQPKAKGEAKAKGQPKAEAPPPPAPEPEAPASTSKNKKKKAKAAPEEPPPPPVVEVEEPEPVEEVKKKKNRRGGQKKKEVGEDGMPVSPLAPKGPSCMQIAEKAADQDPEYIELKKKAHASEKARNIKDMKNLLSDIDKLIEAKKPSFKYPKGNSDQFNTSLAEIRASREGMNAKEKKADTMGAEMEKDLTDKLDKAKAIELFNALKGKLTAMKAKLDDQIKDAEKNAKEAAASTAAKGGKGDDSKGKGKGKGEESQAKREMNPDTILQRLATIKGKKKEDLEGEDVHSETIELPVSIMTYLFTPPFNFFRHFQDEYQVMVQGNRAKGGGKGSVPKDCTIAALSTADVDKVAKALKGLDLSTKKTLEMDGRAMSNVFGPGGSKAREIEKEFTGLYMAQNKNELILVGPSKSVDGALSKIETAASSGAGIVSVVTADIDKTKAIMKDLVKIEQATNTKIKVSHGDGNSRLQIRGNSKDEVDASKSQLEKALDSLKSELVAGTAAGLAKLYKSGGPGSAPEIARKFAEIRNNQDVTILKKGDGLQVVGKGADVKKIKAELADLLVKASFEPLKMKILREQVRLFSNKEVVAGIESKSGAEVKVLRGGEPSLLILGDDKAKEKAKAEIQEIISTEGTVENVSVVDEVSRQLLVSGGAKIKEFESKYGVALNLDKQNNSCRVFGSEKGVKDAVEALEAFQSQVSKDAADAISKELTMEAQQIRLVIGPKGSTLRRIRDACNVKITVDDDNSTVTIKGPENLVAKAEIMINEAVKADGAVPEPKVAPVARPAKGEGKSKKKPATEYKGSAGDFPTLGAAAPGKKASRKPKGAWGKKDGEEEEEEEEAEAEAEAPAAPAEEPAEEAAEEADGAIPANDPAEGDDDFDPLAMCGGMAEEVEHEKSDWLKASEQRKQEREEKGEDDDDEEEEEEEEDK